MWQVEQPTSKGWGVRTCLTALVVVCVFPMVFAGAASTWMYYQHEHSAVATTSVSRARALLSALDREFATTQAVLLALASAPSMQQLQFREFHSQARFALAQFNVDSMLLVNEQKQMVLNTRLPYGQVLPELKAHAMYNRIAQTGRAGVSDLFVSPLTKAKIFAVGVPVFVAPNHRFTMTATMEARRLIPLLLEQRFPANWRVAILDSSGHIVARSHDAAKYVGQPGSPPLLAAMHGPAEGVFDGTTLDGIAVLAAYSRSGFSGWTVAIGVPSDQLAQSIRESLYRLVVATALALIVGLLAAWSIGGRIAHSVRALVAPARALGRNEPLVIGPLLFREAYQVSDALLEAADELQRARHDALHDSLTGLANRAALYLTLARQIDLCRRNRQKVSILFMDLDGFKPVNDQFGHAAGDELLKHVADRLNQCVRHSDLVARLGGDEFAVVLIESDMEHAHACAAKITLKLAAPFLLTIGTVHITASIGVAAFPDCAEDVDSLIKHADASMYAAKQAGGNRGEGTCP